MSLPHQEIDESLYSRQLYVMGHEAQQRMAASSVLLVGLNGLGVEVAKNIILAGVKSVTLLDDKLADWGDLSAQFYLSESSVGKPRAAQCVKQLSELNPYVQVSLETGDALDVAQRKHYTVVVLIDQSHETASKVARHCRAVGSALITGDARGVFGQIFCDFGDQFVVSDSDGEPAASSIIAGISRDNPGLVTVLEETRHQLNTGDVVKLSGIAGMTELNDRQFRVTVKDPFSFEIDFDTRELTPYERGGYCNQVKQPVTVSFQPYEQSFLEPGAFVCDFVKWDHAPTLHLAFRALHEFVQAHGELPRPDRPSDADELVSRTHALNASTHLADDSVLQSHDSLLRRFALYARGTLSPVCAFLGGVLGQEVLKACSGKFMPIKQWFYYDCLEALPVEPVDASDLAPRGCRYDGQIAVFGQRMQERLAQLRLFLVGAGAIGCEMLKNWAMMGVAVAPEGRVVVTDMDQIEKSNLSRQFLFRATDIHQLKAHTAVRAVREMNPAFQAIGWEHKVATETEDIFNDDFYEGLDMVCTALDNVEARLFLDAKCVFYRKPMLESGTLGTKGHTQVVAPRLTENYGATRDPPEKSIPVCTLKHFPNLIEHTLQWAREWFEEAFKQTPEDANAYLTSPTFLAQLDLQPNVKLETLQRVKEILVDQRVSDVETCVRWARRVFEDLFVNRIEQLLYNFPLDRVTSAGTPFWSGAKKPPRPVRFNPQDDLHVEFIMSVANLRAAMFGLPACEDKGYAAALAASMELPPFKPMEGVKIAATDEEAKAESESQRQAASRSNLDVFCDGIITALPTPESLSSFRLRPMEFDKDADAHMRVVAAIGNLRARNYNIPESDLHTCRGIAGKITPAISTTTALVTGAICLEIFKLLQSKPLEQLSNSFVNLAVPLFTSMQPEPPKSTTTIIKGEPWKWTQWDSLDIQDKPTMTVTELIDWLEEEYGLELSMLSSGVTILFSDFMDKKKMAERKKMTLPMLYETVTKKKIHAGQRYLIFEVIANDAESGDELEVPYLRYRL